MVLQTDRQPDRHMHIYIHTLLYTHTHTDIYTTLLHSHTYTHTPVYKHTQQNTRRSINRDAQAHIHKHTHTSTTYTCARTQIRSMCVRSRVHIQVVTTHTVKPKQSQTGPFGFNLILQVVCSLCRDKKSNKEMSTEARLLGHRMVAEFRQR